MKNIVLSFLCCIFYLGEVCAQESTCQDQIARVSISDGDYVSFSPDDVIYVSEGTPPEDYDVFGPLSEEEIWDFGITLHREQILVAPACEVGCVDRGTERKISWEYIDAVNELGTAMTIRVKRFCEPAPSYNSSSSSTNSSYSSSSDSSDYSSANYSSNDGSGSNSSNAYESESSSDGSNTSNNSSDSSSSSSSSSVQHCLPKTNVMVFSPGMEIGFQCIEPEAEFMIDPQPSNECTQTNTLGDDLPPRTMAYWVVEHGLIGAEECDPGCKDASYSFGVYSNPSTIPAEGLSYSVEAIRYCIPE
jgi:hypothetical protein